jgi:predicted secreted protein
LVAQLSASLAIESLRHELSREARERTEGELLTQAAGRFQDKAQAAARALGFRDATIRSVSLNQAQSGSPVPMVRAGLSTTAMAGGAPIPTAEGTTTVTVSLEGSVWLGR